MARLESNSGGGNGPFDAVPVLLGAFFLAPVLLSTLMPESLAPSFLSRSVCVVDARGEARFMFGSTRRFCLEGGRISSRSTGTPSETRKRRRILLRVQLGGCMGGGWTSCCHKERERSERKGELFDMSSGCADVFGGEEVVFGKMRSRYGANVSCSSLPWRPDSRVG